MSGPDLIVQVRVVEPMLAPCMWITHFVAKASVCTPDMSMRWKERKISALCMGSYVPSYNLMTEFLFFLIR